MKAAKQWLLLFTLSSSFIASASVYAADSTGLANTLPAANGGKGVNTYYPDQVTAPGASTTSAYYDKLTHCPGDPTVASGPKFPVCPDINNIWVVSPTKAVPAGTTTSGSSASKDALQTYCPDVCQTNRLVVTGTPITLNGTTYTPITSSSPAVCPSGYVQVSANTPGQDIQYSATPGTPVAVNDQVAYNNYIAQGYTCSGTDPELPINYCSYSNNATVSTSTNTCKPSDVGVAQFYNTGNKTMFLLLTSCPSYTAAEITAGNVSCKLQGVSKCGLAMGVEGMTGVCKSPHATLFTNKYKIVSCSPPAGYYYTSDTVPTKLVCARVKSVWQKRY